MELVLTKKQANDFVNAMELLNKKFRGKYIPGEIEEVVKLNVDRNGNPILNFDTSVNEMVRTACYQAFINTIL